MIYSCEILVNADNILNDKWFQFSRQRIFISIWIIRTVKKKENKEYFAIQKDEHPVPMLWVSTSVRIPEKLVVYFINFDYQK